MKRIEGLIAATYPPLDNDRNLNLSAIGPYAEFLVTNKVDGVFLNGSTGDFVSMSVHERKLIVEEWNRCKPKDFILMAHVGDTNIRQCEELAAHAAQNNVDAIASIAPYYYQPKSVADLVHVCSVIASVAPDVPYYFYHIPELAGSDFDMLEFMELASTDIPNFRGLKFTQQDLMQFKYCLNFENGKYDVLFGVDEILVCGLALGARGCVGSTYNHLTPLYHEIISAFNCGEIEKAHQLQFKSMTFVKTLSKYGFHRAAKATLGILGLDLGPVRLPQQNLTTAEIASLRADLKQIGILDLVEKSKVAI